jgi:hypothetical protein
MDNPRPSLEIRRFHDICPDRNGVLKLSFMNWELRLTYETVQVPVIAVFTKLDQFRRDVKIKLEDEGREVTNLDVEVEHIFGEHYQADLGGSPLFVRLGSKDFSL